MTSPAHFRILARMAPLLVMPVRTQEPAAAESVSIGSSITVTSTILQRPDEAIAILCRNAELYPESTSIRGALADARKATESAQGATWVCPKRGP